MRIYTRKGDDGTTSLWYGGRVAKDDGRTDAYGTLDEANAALGFARSLTGDDADLAADILRIQDELFVAGAELATAPEASERLEDGVSRITPEMATELEPLIDKYMDQVDLPPKFVLPGGTTLSAQLDVARTILRRAERRVVTLKRGGRARFRRPPSLPQPRLRPALRHGALCRRGRPRAFRRARQGRLSLAGSRPQARGVHPRSRDRGRAHDHRRRAGKRRRGRRGSLPHSPLGGVARGVHRDHRRDVRRAQGLGCRSDRSRRRDDLRRPRPHRFDVTLRPTGELSAEQMAKLRVIAGSAPFTRRLPADHR